jgi:uncharacterized membrane protein YhaH (DUF805 family)/cold shock CspA family protein
MRGEVLHYDDEQGFGFINGSDGRRYAFERSDLRRLIPLSKGTPVEFQPEGASAREIFVVRGAMTSTAASQFGRDALVAEPEATGLWSYFTRALTTNYANFRGRARRKEYWGYALFWLIFFAVACSAAAYFDAGMGNFDIQDDRFPFVITTVAVLFVLATFIPSLALTIRRQHDIGLSGWFYLLILVPYVGNLIIFVFTLIPSQKHDNRWGPVPYGVRI